MGSSVANAEDLWFARNRDKTSTYTERFLSSLMALISIFLLPIIAATVSEIHRYWRDLRTVASVAVFDARGLCPSTESESEAAIATPLVERVWRIFFGCN
jgi:hypothetical protein